MVSRILCRWAVVCLVCGTFLLSTPIAQTTFSNATDKVDFQNGKTKDFVWGDLNGDGRLDIFDAISNSVENFLFLNQLPANFLTQGPFGPPVSGITYDSDAFDANRDGLLDVLRVNSGTTFLFLNDGMGSFSPIIELCDGAGVCIPTHNWDDAAIGDVDGDGDLDILLAENQVHNSQHTILLENLNVGSGLAPAFEIAKTFFAPTTCGGTGCAAHDVDLGDIDGDGDLDIVIGYGGNTNFSVQNEIWMNDPSGPFDFTKDSTRLPNSPDITSVVKFVDLDNDGDLDLFVGNVADPWSKIFINDGSGFFRDETSTRIFPSNLGASFEAYQADFGDIDLDGDIDFVTAVSASGSLGNLLFINKGEQGEQGVFDSQNVEASNAPVGPGVCTNQQQTECFSDADCPGNFTCTLPPPPPPTMITGSGERLTAEMGDADGDGDLDIIWGATNPLLIMNDGDGTGFQEMEPLTGSVGGGTPFLMRCLVCDKFFTEGVTVLFESFGVFNKANNVRLLNASTIYGVTPQNVKPGTVNVKIQPVETPAIFKTLTTSFKFLSEGMVLNADSSSMTVLDSTDGVPIDLDPSTPLVTESEENFPDFIPVAAALEEVSTNRRAYIAARSTALSTYHIFGFNTGLNQKIGDEFDTAPAAPGIEGVTLPSEFTLIRSVATEPETPSMTESRFLFIPYSPNNNKDEMDIGVFDIRQDSGSGTRYSILNDGQGLLFSNAQSRLFGRPLDIEMKWTTGGALLAFVTTDENNLTSDIESAFTSESTGGASAMGIPTCNPDCGGGGGGPSPTRNLKVIVIDVTPDLTDPANPAFNGSVVATLPVSGAIFSTFDEPQLQEFGMDFNGDQSKLFIASPDTNQVVVYDAATFIFQNTIPVGTKPVDVDIEDIPNKGEKAYVVNYGSDDVSIIDLADFSVINLGLATNSTPTAIALRSDGKFGFSTNFGDNTVTMIDLGTTPEQIFDPNVLPTGILGPRRVIIQATR